MFTAFPSSPLTWTLKNLKKDVLFMKTMFPNGIIWEKLYNKHKFQEK